MFEFDLSVRRGPNLVQASAALPLGTMLALAGPSGAGKSLLLRVMAGVEDDVHGYLSLADHVWVDERRGRFRAPEHRRIAWCPQQQSLFPHLNVRDNVNFGARRRPGNPGQMDVDEALDVMEVASLRARRVQALSGGEYQRVMLARALAMGGDLVLLDEPFSAQDTRRRRRLTQRLRQRFLATGQTVVLVTHVLSDAVRMCDRYLWLDQGRVVQAGDIHELAQTGLMASGEGGGPSTIVDCRIADRHEEWGLLELASPLGTLWLESSGLERTSDDLRIGIRAADVSISLTESDRTSMLNRLWLEIESISELEEHPGQRLILLRNHGETRLAARLTAYSVDRLGLRPGLRVLAQIKAVAVES